jgi:predicted ATPase/class 3 adenylate cyclase
MEIGGWLRSLGLERYEAAFRDNAIDETVLPNLTTEDLKELGVAAVGHRRKLLDAIAALRAGVKPSPPESAERRQVTVMFSDLVGSTALSARMDPEDLRDVIADYQKCVAEAVRRFDGFIAKYMGDGVLVYFGYPQAHEHDAERAVRAGLELAAAVAALKSRVPLQARVGIATGLVVVGDLIGSGEAQERGIVGETPNLAARLQGVAEPGEVVLAEGTRKLLGNLFELRDLGAHDLKGLAAPVRAFAALRASAVESRFEALTAGRMTALVGRREESERLLRGWQAAKGGRGQALLLSGEAGIGKSRLTAGLTEHLANEQNAGSHATLRFFCSSQRTDSALFPFVSQLERAAGLVREDAPQARLDKLDAWLRQTATSMEHAALFAEMLSLANDGRYPALDLPATQRRQRTLDALAAHVETLSRSGPVLMVFEDVHWIDPTSLEALTRIIGRIAALPVLLVATSRPEFVPPPAWQASVTLLALGRLPQDEIAAMIDRVAGRKPIPANIRREIVERTDGIPLFVEEMTKAVLEAENESAANRTAAGVPSPALAVPASLHASLMARLDRLGPAKEIAQMGAAIGREFSRPLLALVADKPGAELDAALERLLAAGLLFRTGQPPDATYQFNHALVQDAAYGTLLRERRRALHARIADVLEGHFGDVAESQPELVARHYTEAGVAVKAAALWGKAGQRSLARSALVEAAEQLARALSQIEALPGTAALRREQIRLQIDLSNALIHTEGHASPQTRASFERARTLIKEAEALGEPPDDPLVLFSVLYGFWVANRMAFKGDVACELAKQFQVLAGQQTAVVPRMIGHMLMGISLVLVGDIANGRVELDRTIELYDPAAYRRLATRFGHDVRVTALCWRALALWMLDDPGAAAADIDRTLQDAREIDHAATSMFALSHTALALVLSGDRAAAKTRADELVALAESKGSLYWKSYGMLLQGWLLALAGQAQEAIPLGMTASTAMRSTGATAYAPWYLSWLAKAYAELGQLDDARRCIAEAERASQTSGETWFDAEIYRVFGEVESMSPVPDRAKAEGHFERALAVARRQQAKSFERRAAESLAYLQNDRA